MNKPRPAWQKVAPEIIKWGLVLWLVWPITRAMHERVSFSRIALGILLLIIFVGRTLYDAILDPMLSGSRANKGADWVAFAGAILIIALVVGLTILFIALYVAQSLSVPPPSE